MATFNDALQTLADSEQKFVDVVRSIAALYNSGRLQPADVAVYDAARVQVYTAQLVAWGVYMEQVRARLPDAVAQLVPIPQIAPQLPLGVRNAATANYRPPAPAASTTAGLGVAPLVIAIGAFEMTLPLWAVVVVAIAAVLAVGYAIYVTGDTLQKMQRLDAVLGAMRDCLATGRSAADCGAALAQVSPPPGDTSPPGDMFKWIAIGAAAVAVLALLTRSSGGGSGTTIVMPRLTEGR